MLNLRLIKTIVFSIFFSAISGCAPFVPDNYLSPRTVMTSQKVNGHWITPTLIPINAETLNSSSGYQLLAAAMDPQAYRIGPYDNLNIIVWGHPELSTVASSSAVLPGGGMSSQSQSQMTTSNPAVLVQSDGTIYYPYVGHLQASSLTINELQNKITKRLSVYIRNPQVTVQVAKFRNRNIYVLGEVKDSGMQPITDKPLTLMEAISDAGGIDPTSADPSHIYLIRGSYLRPDIFILNAQSPQSLMIGERFPLQENDIIYVSSATLTGVNHFLNTILPSISTYIIAKEFTK